MKFSALCQWLRQFHIMCAACQQLRQLTYLQPNVNGSDKIK